MISDRVTWVLILSPPVNALSGGRVLHRAVGKVLLLILLYSQCERETAFEVQVFLKS